MTDYYSGNMGVILVQWSKMTLLFIEGVRAEIRNALVIGVLAST